MKDLEKDIFIQEWRFAEQEEFRRKKRQKYLFWTAVALNYVQKMKEEFRVKREEYLKSFLTPYVNAYGGDIDTAIQEVKKARDELQEEHKRAEEHFEKIKDAPLEDQTAAIQAQLIIAVHKFSQAKSKQEAASLAVLIDTGLKNIDKNPEIRQKISLSTEFMKQAREAGAMGHVIEDGLEALENALVASRREIPLTEEQQMKNLNAIIKMELVDPSSVLAIRSPEIDALQKVMKKTSVQATKKETAKEKTTKEENRTVKQEKAPEQEKTTNL